MSKLSIIFLGIMWIVDTVGYIFKVNTSHIIDVLNECYYIFLDHPALNAVLFTGIVLIIAAILFSRLEKQIKGGVK